MFPNQNLHYLKNFSVGVPGLNYVKATEYDNRYRYDKKQAGLAYATQSPTRLRRKATVLDDIVSQELYKRYNRRQAYAPSEGARSLLSGRYDYPNSLPVSTDRLLQSADLGPLQRFQAASRLEDSSINEKPQVARTQAEAEGKATLSTLIMTSIRISSSWDRKRSEIGKEHPRTHTTGQSGGYSWRWCFGLT